MTIKISNLCGMCDKWTQEWRKFGNETDNTKHNKLNITNHIQNCNTQGLHSSEDSSQGLLGCNAA